MGYEFDINSDKWKLNSDITFKLNAFDVLEPNTRKGFRLALSRYAEELAGKTTQGIVSYLKEYMKVTGERAVSVNGLSNYRSTLKGDTESHLGALRAFFYAWHDWEFPGVSKEVVDYLESLTLKGIVKGKAVKGRCPYSGAYTPNEQVALIEWVSGAFSKGTISLTQYALFLSLMMTGRRAVQIRALTIGDIVVRESKDKTQYFLNVPRVKQKTSEFREEFRLIPITDDLYWILKNQADASVKRVETKLGQKLPEPDKRSLPLFLDTKIFNGLTSLEHLRSEQGYKQDYLFMTASECGGEIRKLSIANQAISERTGEYIHITSRRFRYTKGTNFSRRGVHGIVLAEALDHSDKQHVGVYVENTVETAEAIDEVMAPFLAHLAQAFQGDLINSERDAIRAADPRSRIRNNRENAIGSCGTSSFCASGFRACYTCVNFQPWRDGPHKEVRDDLIKERMHQRENQVSEFVIQSTDRLLIAVEQVILMCDAKQGELTHE
ncbi:site-specific integrase [Lacimicrobium alkaliphilum]|uniref:Integrase n=1 Tax=Lacimicrobium alkaliphilum TaxID=1526571 RepID=A0ABQ1R7X3_9ALTE|nr:site-specific integrase [Lacimicrobium alkaliphilum]GGD61584.1 integrase [Lacimicrobium alkaliphilum]